MIMGCNSTLLWSTNHTGLSWTALNANEPWLEYWTAARPRSSTPFAPWGIRHMIMAVTLHHLQHCHYCYHGWTGLMSINIKQHTNYCHHFYKHRSSFKLNNMRRNKHVGPLVHICLTTIPVSKYVQFMYLLLACYSMFYCFVQAPFTAILLRVSSLNWSVFLLFT